MGTSLKSQEIGPVIERHSGSQEGVPEPYLNVRLIRYPGEGQEWYGAKSNRTKSIKEKPSMLHSKTC